MLNSIVRRNLGVDLLAKEHKDMFVLDEATGTIYINEKYVTRVPAPTQTLSLDD